MNTVKKKPVKVSQTIVPCSWSAAVVVSSSRPPYAGTSRYPRNRPCTTTACGRGSAEAGTGSAVSGSPWRTEGENPRASNKL